MIFKYSEASTRVSDTWEERERQPDGHHPAVHEVCQGTDG